MMIAFRITKARVTRLKDHWSGKIRKIIQAENLHLSTASRRTDGENVSSYIVAALLQIYSMS